MTEKSTAKAVISWVLALLIGAGVFYFVLFGINDIRGKMTASGLETTEQNLRRAAAACYALEGQYPPSLEYLTENYGLNIDEERYAVHYEAFASNLMPDITVTAR